MLGGLEGGENLFQGFGAGLKAGDQFQIVALRGLHEGGGILDGSDFGEEGIAALFRGLECGGLPLVDFLVGATGIEVDLGAVAFERNDARGADLGGFAHDGVHRRTFGQRLAEGDFVSERFCVLVEADLEDGGVFAIGRELADPFGAAAIERDDGVAGAGAIDGDEVVRFLRRENDFGRLGGGGITIRAEVGHGPDETASAKRDKCCARAGKQ